MDSNHRLTEPFSNHKKNCCLSLLSRLDKYRSSIQLKYPPIFSENFRLSESPSEGISLFFTLYSFFPLIILYHIFFRLSRGFWKFPKKFLDYFRLGSSNKIRHIINIIMISLFSPSLLFGATFWWCHNLLGLEHTERIDSVHESRNIRRDKSSRFSS